MTQLVLDPDGASRKGGVPKWSSLFGPGCCNFGFLFPRSPVEMLTLFQLTMFAVIRPDGKQGQGSPPRTLVIATTFPACGNHTFPHLHTFSTTPGFGIQGSSTPHRVYSNRGFLHVQMCPATRFTYVHRSCVHHDTCAPHPP